MEVGAINCEKPANKRICTDWLSVAAYPTLVLLNRKHGTLATYPKDEVKSSERVRAWALDTAREWWYLFDHANVSQLSAQTFTSAVIDDEQRAWIVLFTDGFACAPCRTARTNLLRLSASLRGLPVGIGVVDCERPTNVAYCRQVHKMPERPHAPAFLAWPRGPKRRGGDLEGEPLVAPGDEIESHVALQLIDRGLRLALANERDAGLNDGGLGEAGPFDEEPKAAGWDDGGGLRSPQGGVRWDGPRASNAKPLPWNSQRPVNANHRLE